MNKARTIAIGVGAALAASHAAFGWETTYLIGYGAVAQLALVISATFLWLWARRATPLALGMACGWAGAGSLVGWWWIYSLWGQPAWMATSVWVFVWLGLYLTGATLHLVVIRESFPEARGVWWPIAAVAVLVSALLAFAMPGM